MIKVLMLPIMIFLHIVDDYYLQGLLAKFKQKKFWLENVPDDLYKNDYKCALITHGFSWAFSILLPILVYIYKTNIDNNILVIFYIVFLIVNTAIHSYVDNLKANKLSISLVTDQSIHMIQIIFTFISFVVINNIGGVK